MSGSVSMQYSSMMTITEVLGTNVPAASVPAITHDGLNKTASFNANTTPPATLTAIFVQALTGGAATIDMTALLGTNGALVNGNGLKVRAVKMQAPIGNANPIMLKFGAANPYNLLGANWQITLSPGQEALFLLNDSAPVIGAGAKNIDVSGTGTQTVEIGFVIG